VPPLFELQKQVRAAIVGSAAEFAVPLVGGRCPLQRLAIHRRHYELSLIDVLLRRFPATQWLLGSASVRDAARAYVYQQPPVTACLNEYGGQFPMFLASRRRVPGLRWFAELEWQLGVVTLCIDLASQPIQSLAGIEPEMLASVRLQLQPGLRFYEAPWPIDELINFYLTEAAPSTYCLQPQRVRLQLHGARGEFRLRRLGEGEFVFRRALADGEEAGRAGEWALEVEPNFPVGPAFASLVAEGLMTGFRLPSPTE
jgi:Putative DNA-binding domain